MSVHEGDCRNQNIELITDIEDNIIIKADYDKMRRLAVILVDNAVKYTEEGRVTVTLKPIKQKGSDC